jgi:hypothetical protein
MVVSIRGMPWHATKHGGGLERKYHIPRLGTDKRLIAGKCQIGLIKPRICHCLQMFMATTH